MQGSLTGKLLLFHWRSCIDDRGQEIAGK